MKKINFLFLIFILFPFFGFSQMAPEGLEALTITESENGTKTYSVSLKILALMTALTILPSLVLGMTAFTRIIIVMSILRQALGTQQTPPNQILVAISLFLTFFVMAPTFNKIYSDVSEPYNNGEMNLSEAWDELIKTTLRVANGRLTCAEALGHKEFVMTKLYRSA